VLAVIKLNTTPSPQADFGMPMSGAVSVASVRALPTTGVVSGVAAGWERDRIDATPECGYSRLAPMAVFTGTFPGTSAWSPPI
jgi:hypothetical protein